MASPLQNKYLSVLFWNLRKRPLKTRVARLVAHTSADIVILAENSISDLELIDTIKKSTGKTYHIPQNLSPKIQLLTSLPVHTVVDRFNSELEPYTLRSVRIAGYVELTLCAIHLQSKVSWDAIDQTVEMTNIIRGVIDFEKKVGHDHTVVIGDLNMNPFEPGLTASHCMNAVMSRCLLRKRTVAAKSYLPFYNPMWGLFGDRTPGPPGTYYFAKTKPTNTYWQMLDQLILRPSLVETLIDIRIMNTDGVQSLLKKNGRPDDNRGSDHLPIFIQLDLARIQQ